MSRDYRLFLDDIRDSCAKVLRYTAGMNFEQFVDEEQVFDAVVRNLGIIGEATKHVPNEIRNLYPQVDWKKISGLRDVVVHGYFGIDEEILWDIIQNHVPELLEQVTQILGND